MDSSAPLISIPEASAPAGATAEWVIGGDGARLRAAWFPLATGSRGTVVLSPGRTEPIEKYFETIDDLHGRGFQVLAHDWRGQGLSQRALPDRLKGHAEGVEPFLADFQRVLDAFSDRLTHPLIALSHSMGGGLTLLAMARGETRFDATILTAPMLAVSTAPAPRELVAMGASFMRMTSLGSEYAIKGQDPLAETFEGNRLTHDRARFDRYRAQLRACPDLALGGLTWGWLDFALHLETAMGETGLLESVAAPVRIVAAGQEQLVLNEPMRRAAERLAKATYVEIPGALHEILMETDDLRDPFWQAFDQLAAELSPPPA